MDPLTLTVLFGSGLLVVSEVKRRKKKKEQEREEVEAVITGSPAPDTACEEAWDAFSVAVSEQGPQLNAEGKATMKAIFMKHCKNAPAEQVYCFRHATPGAPPPEECMGLLQAFGEEFGQYIMAEMQKGFAESFSAAPPDGPPPPPHGALDIEVDRGPPPPPAFAVPMSQMPGTPRGAMLMRKGLVSEGMPVETEISETEGVGSYYRRW